MSYSFAVKKVDGTLVLDHPEYLEQVAQHVPDGAVFVINGHEPGPGFSSVATLGVTLSIARDGSYAEHVAAAQCSRNVPQPATVTLAETESEPVTSGVFTKPAEG